MNFHNYMHELENKATKMKIKINENFVCNRMHIQFDCEKKE